MAPKAPSSLLLACPASDLFPGKTLDEPILIELLMCFCVALRAETRPVLSEALRGRVDLVGDLYREVC